MNPQWPNPGPGRLPMDSARGQVEFASVIAFVASLVDNFVSECIFWGGSLVNPLRKIHVGKTIGSNILNCQ